MAKIIRVSQQSPYLKPVELPFLDHYCWKISIMAMTTEEMVFIFCSNGVFIPWLALMFAPK